MKNAQQSRGVAKSGQNSALAIHVPRLEGMDPYTGNVIFNGEIDIVAWEASLAARKVAGDKGVTTALIEFAKDTIKDGGHKQHEMKQVKVLGRSGAHYQILLFQNSKKIATCAVEHKFVRMKDRADNDVDGGTVINMNGTAPGMFSLVRSSK